tara:strand:+ start:1629 stop:2291 length:663 start_codon:yes stop_codon:yes gene_type:complete
LREKERLKSFVLRKGRVTSNQKRAIQDLWDEFVIFESSDLQKSWVQEKLALDIGFGAGETTAYLSRAKPNMSIIGAEVYLSGIGSLLSKIRNENLQNIKILNSDVVAFLENNDAYFFDLVLMFYPDPWPKRKHHKRRLFKDDFLQLLNKKVKKEGIFYFKTDWQHYFDEVMKIELDSNTWQVIKKKELEDYLIKLPQTSFELKAMESKREVFELILKKIN